MFFINDVFGDDKYFSSYSQKINIVVYSLRKFLPTRCLFLIYYSLAYSRVHNNLGWNF